MVYKIRRNRRNKTKRNKTRRNKTNNYRLRNNKTRRNKTRRNKTNNYRLRTNKTRRKNKYNKKRISRSNIKYGGSKRAPKGVTQLFNALVAEATPATRVAPPIPVSPTFNLVPRFSSTTTIGPSAEIGLSAATQARASAAKSLLSRQPLHAPLRAAAPPRFQSQYLDTQKINPYLRSMLDRGPLFRRIDDHFKKKAADTLKNKVKEYFTELIHKYAKTSGEIITRDLFEILNNIYLDLGSELEVLFGDTLFGDTLLEQFAELKTVMLDELSSNLTDELSLTKDLFDFLNNPLEFLNDEEAVANSPSIRLIKSLYQNIIKSIRESVGAELNIEGIEQKFTDFIFAQLVPYVDVHSRFFQSPESVALPSSSPSAAEETQPDPSTAVPAVPAVPDPPATVPVPATFPEGESEEFS